MKMEGINNNKVNNKNNNNNNKKRYNKNKRKLKKNQKIYPLQNKLNAKNLKKLNK